MTVPDVIARLRELLAQATCCTSCANERDEDTGITTKKTAAEWIASHGRGFLCSTEA